MTHNHDTIMDLANQYSEATVSWVAIGEPTTKARAALSAALADLIAERDLLRSEHLEQARLLGISGSREAALVADLENEKRKVTELVDGYEKDQVELKQLRAEVAQRTADWKEATTKNREMLAEVERLNALVLETATQYNKALQDTQADVERLTLEKKAAAMNYEAVIEQLKAQEPFGYVDTHPFGQDYGIEIRRHYWKGSRPVYLASGAATKTLSDFVHSSDSEREKVGNVVVAKADEDMDKLVKLSGGLGLYDGAAQTSKTIDVKWHHDLAPVAQKVEPRKPMFEVRFEEQSQQTSPAMLKEEPDALGLFHNQAHTDLGPATRLKAAPAAPNECGYEACDCRGYCQQAVQRENPSAKHWPFVETPGEFTERLQQAMQEFPGYLLGAVRNVLIENPPALAKQVVPAAQDADVITINGKRYAAALFGKDGFFAPAGTVLRIEDGPEDVVTCTTLRAAPEAQNVAGPSGDFLSDFSADQWWLLELDAAVANGTDDQKRAVAVVRNLLATVAAQLAAPAQPLTEALIMDMTRPMMEVPRWPSTAIDIARTIEAAHGITLKELT